MNVTHFRAYAQATGQKAYTKTDDEGIVVLDKRGRPIRAAREWSVEEVAFTGATKDGRAEFDAGDVVITRVVFLSHVPHEELVAQHQEMGVSLSLNADEYEPDGAEVVVGSVEIGTAGHIVAACPDPDED